MTLSRWKIAVALLVLSVVALACGDSPTSPSPDGVPPAGSVTGEVSAGPEAQAQPKEGPTFDWSMPARFGMDSDSDGLIDYIRDPSLIAPDSWTVDFDACDLPSGETYEWQVDGRQVASIGSCSFSYGFPAEGNYRVKLKIRGKGPQAKGVLFNDTEIVTVDDRLVISFGDSYASGEGLPEVPLISAADAAAIEALWEAIIAAEEFVKGLRETLAEELRPELANTRQARDELVAERNETIQARNQYFDNCVPLPAAGWTFADCVALAATVGIEIGQDLGAGLALFDAAIADLQEAIDDLNDTIDDLVRQIADLEAQIAAALAGLPQLDPDDVKWQPPYAVEDEIPERGCNRSALAQPALVALALEQADPRTSVTFVHLACSGGQMEGNEGNNVENQVRYAAELIGDRDPELVFLSIGGNDLGFADVVTACLSQQPCYSDDFAVIDALEELRGLLSLVGLLQPAVQIPRPEKENAQEIVDQRLPTLDPRYDRLAERLLALGVPPERVYITQYPDLTKDDSGAYCGGIDPSDPVGGTPGFTQDEMEWADREFLSVGNDAVRSAALEHGWSLVDGIYPKFREHGYCADDNWIEQLNESFLIQGTYHGMVHPNWFGHPAIASELLAAVQADLQ